LARVNGNKEAKLEDFLLDFTKEPRGPQTVEEQIMAAKMFAIAFGGTIDGMPPTQGPFEHPPVRIMNPQAQQRG
jgi:hypothetical protein